jgi:hypothetical protein
MTKRKQKKRTDLGHIAPPLRPMARTVASLHEDADNVRLHDERNLAAIAASLQRFGQQAPVVYVMENRRAVVKKGNGLLAAARSLGWTHLAAVKSDLSGQAATAFAIADNRTCDLSEFDAGLLAAQLEELRETEIPLEAAGFSDSELADMLAELEEVDEEEGEETPAGDGSDRHRGERVATIVIGHLKFDIARGDFDAWLAAVEDKVGNDPDRVIREVKRRLKLPPAGR